MIVMLTIVLYDLWIHIISFSYSSKQVHVSLGKEFENFSGMSSKAKIAVCDSKSTLIFHIFYSVDYVCKHHWIVPYYFAHFELCIIRDLINHNQSQTTHLYWLKVMYNFPRNVAEFLEVYRQKMKGYEATISKVKQSVEQFKKLREQSDILKRIEIFQCQYQGKSFSQLYQVKMKGRKNTNYHCRIIPFYIFFFDGFPEEPPEIIAPYYVQQQSYRPFLHLNMDGNGHVCTQSNQKEKQYFKSTTLKDILIQLENMIYNPNISSSYPSQLFTCYQQKGDNSQYQKKLNKQASFLQSFQEDQSSSSESSSDND